MSISLQLLFVLVTVTITTTTIGTKTSIVQTEGNILQWCTQTQLRKFMIELVVFVCMVMVEILETHSPKRCPCQWECQMQEVLEVDLEVTVDSIQDLVVTEGVWVSHSHKPCQWPQVDLWELVEDTTENDKEVLFCSESTIFFVIFKNFFLLKLSIKL